MHCIIDRGNTKTKIYFFKEDTLKSSFSAINEEEEALASFLSKNKYTKGIFSSSSDVPLFMDTTKFLILNKETPLPFTLNYNTPETLGTDRIALAAGAHFLYPQSNCLVISTGTCITIDLIDKKSVYQGGIISLGLTIRLEAMHTFTENLPLLRIKKQASFPLIGKSTEESMESGVYNGTISEIDQTISQFKAIYKDLTAIITGGDHKMFELHLKNEIFAQPNLQAIGLNRILLHNAR
jgi:type III pantothenate kinase